jgi:hypothetical protein
MIQHQAESSAMGKIHKGMPKYGQATLILHNSMTLKMNWMMAMSIRNTHGIVVSGTAMRVP